jgi:FkbM family methyltransferase
MIRNSRFLYEVLKLRPQFVIHIGAHLGQDRAEYLALKCREIVWIEADPTTAGKLIEKYPEDKVINLAIWDEGGLSLELYQFQDEEQNSLIQPLLGNKREKLEIRSIKVGTLTLDELFETPEFTHLQGGWLTIDVQGAELHVLAGAGDSLKRIDYLVIEIANTSQGYAETPTLREVETILQKSDLHRSLSRISHDGTYTDYLFTRGSKKTRIIVNLIDSCFAFGTNSLHFLRKRHIKSSPFYCEKCNNMA